MQKNIWVNFYRILKMATKNPFQLVLLRVWRQYLPRHTFSFSRNSLMLSNSDFNWRQNPQSFWKHILARVSKRYIYISTVSDYEITVTDSPCNFSAIFQKRFQFCFQENLQNKMEQFSKIRLNFYNNLLKYFRSLSAKIQANVIW